MDAGQAPADITLNEANLQKNDVPLVVVESGTTRRSLQDANISHMRALFQVELEEARSGFENRLAEMYQRKLDDMKKQLLVVEKEKQCYQESATTAINKCSEMSQQLAAVQNTNRAREDEVSMLCDEYDKYKLQTEQQLSDMSTTVRDHSARYQQVIEEKEQLAEMHQRQEVSLCRQLDDMKNQLLVAQQAVQKHQDTATAAINNSHEMSTQLAALLRTHRDEEKEVSRVRDEYATYKKQTEQQMQEMSATIRDHTARYQQVIEEKEQLAELCANISAGIKACDALKKGKGDCVSVATPQRLSDQNSRGPKRKRPDVSSSRVTASASRINSVARSRSPSSSTTRTTSADRSCFSRKIRRQDAGKGIRTGKTGKKEIRGDKLAKAMKKRGGFWFSCGICQKQLGGVGRSDQAISHMLGFRPKAGSTQNSFGPCTKWREGTLDGRDRQDYLLGKYPQRGVRYVKYKNGKDGEVVEEGYEDWPKEMQDKRAVVISKEDKKAAKAARAANG